MEEEPYVVPVTEDMFLDEAGLDDDGAELVQEYDEAEEAFERAKPKRKRVKKQVLWLAYCIAWYIWIQWTRLLWHWAVLF